MSTAETIKAIDDEIKRQEADLQRLREERAAIAQEDRTTIDDQCLMDAVLNCPHSITHESVTLHFYPRQKEGHNALAQLRHRLAAYNLAARQREMQLLGEIEALERLALNVLKQLGAETAPQVQAAANTTDQSRAQFDAWIRTHEDEHGAVDEASAWAAWSACSLMQAASSGVVQEGWTPVSERLPDFMDFCDWLMPMTDAKRERWILANESMATASVPGQATQERV